MERLSSSQQEALEHLQGILERHNYDAEVLTSVLESLDWDVQRATGLLMDEVEDARPVNSPLRDRQTRQIQPDSHLDEGAYEPPRSWMRMFFSLLYLPIGLVSGILRFVSGILRVPLLTLFNTTPNYRQLRQTHSDSRSTTRRWITSLEEETGAVSLKSTTVTATGLDDRQSASRRHTYPPTNTVDENKILPDFFDGTYEELLDICQKEGRIACVILVSAEHDDVAEFKRSTLTHPGLVRMLSDNDFVVWGGDIRDRDSWDAAQKLQATTYPFVAFLALQPRRSPSSSSSSTSAPMLTVLSRHHGPSVPVSGPTSAQTLLHHLENQLLPRVNPFLTRFKLQLQERERDRIIREQQDRAFQESAERDRQRLQARVKAEQEEAERSRVESEARREEDQRIQLEQEKQAKIRALRLQYRCWMRRYIVPPEHHGPNGIRLALRLPGNTRVVRAFPPGSTLTELYAFVDIQAIPTTLQPENDPKGLLNDGPGPDLPALERYMCSQASWWGFKLVRPYPRREIEWSSSVTLVDAGLKSGEQLVVEVLDASDAFQHCSDDEYESE